MANGLLQTAQMLPAPSFGLLGQVVVAGDAHDDSKGYFTWIGNPKAGGTLVQND